MTPRGRGHCAVCDRVFTLTHQGTIPGHTLAGRSDDAMARNYPTCAGAYQPPRDGTATAR